MKTLPLPRENSYGPMARAKGLVARRDLFRKRRPQFRDDHEGEANRDQKERKELTAGKTSNQARVRLAEIFNDDPKDRVANEEQTSQNTVRLPRPSPDRK